MIKIQELERIKKKDNALQVLNEAKRDNKQVRDAKQDNKRAKNSRQETKTWKDNKRVVKQATKAHTEAWRLSSQFF